MRQLQLLFMCLWLVLTGLSAQSRIQHQNEQQLPDQAKEYHAGKGKTSYLTVSGMLGSSAFNYKLNSLDEKGSHSSQFGYGIDLKYSYFFTSHWGVSTGVGISHYASKGKLKGSLEDNKYYSLGSQIDNDIEGRPKEFDFRARITNLEEKQTAYFVEIPLMLAYQTPIGKQHSWGAYGAIGAKFQFPVNAKFKIQNGAENQLNVSGYYKDIPTDMGSPSNPPVVQHGYGTITDPNATLDWNDDFKLKMGVAAAIELGLIFKLNDGLDLLAGGYLDYSFIDIKKEKEQALFTAPSVYHPAADNKIGYGLKYNGMLNSELTGKIRPLAFGLKVGLRFKVGE